ncbi:TonB-dependent receptor plug domain-containing protein [Paradesertivirga mongoliensis]|uniref:TonB-dependent receptor plug domain-containing protein n=1 Tax=Paradesertivirga mongoliensis TaxID=2100740 RepID=A0ABW4ZRJ8_9SPHI|nr:TonB-dependent receptor [Pedobacter mongoliensis]
MKKLTTIAAGLGLAQLALISSGALAQDTTRTINSQTDLEQVVVTATRSAKRKAEVGKVVRVITSEQIQRSQGRTLPEVLNNVAGITYSGANNAQSNTSASLFLRGASAGNTLILIDGIPVNDAQSISNEYDLKSIAIDQIERVEILKGGNSTLYGSDAVAGVINIITKKPTNQDLNANVILTAGSYNANKQAIGLNGSVGKTGIAFNYSHTGSKEFSAATDAAGDKNFDRDGYDQHTLSFNGKQQLSERLSVNTNIQLSNNNGMSDGGSFADDKDYTYDRTHFFGGITGRYALENGIIIMNLSNNTVSSKFLNRPDDGSSALTTNNKGRIWQADLFVNKPLTSFLELNSGVNYRSSNSDQFSQYNAYDPEILESENAKSDISSVFTSVFLKNMGGFHLELGGRYNHHSKYGDNFTYTFNPSYLFWNRYKVFFNASSAFKAPTLYQLHSQYRNPDGNLKPEITQTYDAGLDLDIIKRKLNFNATVFQRLTKDDVIYFYSENVAPWKMYYKNGRKQNDKGLELELNAHPLQDLNISVWYSFIKGKATDENGAEIESFLRRPKNSFGWSAGYSFSKLLSFNMMYKYTGHRVDVYYEGFNRRSVDLKSYTLLDVYLQSQPIKNITFFGDFKNVLDTGYVEWAGYNTRGFNFNAGIKYLVR